MFKKLITLVLVTIAIHGFAQKNETTSKEYAQQITKKFQDANKGAIQGHLYGKIIMNELTGLANISKIHVFNAQDGDGKIHVVFKATDLDGEIINKSYAVELGNDWPPKTNVTSVKNIGGKLEDGEAQVWASRFTSSYPERPSVFSFEVSEFTKILSVKNSEGMFFLYGKEGDNESLVAGAIDGDANLLWDNSLSVSKGEKTCSFYPVIKTVATKAYTQKITKAFQNANKGNLYGHLYGKIILNELTGLSNVKNIHVFNAQDGAGKVHLVFKATGQNGEILNKDYAVEVGAGYPPQTASNTVVATLGGKLDDATAQQWVNRFQNYFTERAAVFSFDVNEFKKILSLPNAEGMFFAYALEGTQESMVIGALDGKANFLWDEYITISKGEKSSIIYPGQKTARKN